MSVKHTVKRSMSPDGKIDAVSVEIEFLAEGHDTQAVLDTIQATQVYYDSVRPNGSENSGEQTQSSNGGQQQVEGEILAVYDGEPSKTSGRRGPGAIVIEGIKVKTFDLDILKDAKRFKAAGVPAKITYARNEKWKSNDASKIEAVS